jgi:hypothetical protein
MSGGWRFDDAPCEEHANWAASGRFLFASPSWGDAMERLGARPIFAWCPHRRLGLMIPIFRRAGLRFGFLGFPVTGEALDGLTDLELEGLAAQALSVARLHLLRIVRGNRFDMADGAHSARPDLWIGDLPSWRPERRLRRDLAFAQRSRNGMRIVTGLVDPTRCFDLYAAVVRGHGGSIRYTQGYFGALASLAVKTTGLFASSALDAAGELRAFAVAARHGSWAYYLHGAADGMAKRSGLSDSLLAELVARAKAEGCKHFSLMASPWQQPGLIRFKQKWGDRRGLVVTRDLGRGPLGMALCAAARWRTRHDRDAARAWLASVA